MLKNRKAIKKQKKMTMSMKIIPTDFSLVSQFTSSNDCRLLGMDNDGHGLFPIASS